MLSTLDIIIAFAVIMTVLSLLITIIVQMVSGALSLRGKNLANALALTFQTIDPKIEEQAHSLAAQILRDPIFSDSMFRPKDRQLRGNPATRAQADVERAEKNLAEAEQDSKRVKATDAAAKEKADARVAKAKGVLDRRERQLKAELANGHKVEELKPIANRTTPWRSFSLLKLGDATALGSAIRPGEIYRILHEIADLTKTEAAVLDVCSDLPVTAKRIIACLGHSDLPANESFGKLQVIADVAKLFPDAQRQAIVSSLDNLGATVERATTQAYDRFQRWFGSAQDRAEQWFQSHVRIITICSSVVIAFVLQLDTAAIFRQLRDQPKLVEALVKSAPGVLEKGGTVLEPSDTPAYHAYLLWLKKHPLFPLDELPKPGEEGDYAKALAKRVGEKLATDLPVSEYTKAFDREKTVEGAAKPSEAAMAKAAYDSWVQKFPTYGLPPGYDFTKATKDSIKKEIRALVDKDADNKPNAEALLQDYADMKADGVYAYERARQKTFIDLQDKLTDAGFDLAPRPLFGRWIKEPTPAWAGCLPRPVALFFVHFLGVLATAGLLSLGAPFWFNLLKNLMNLRPAMANLVEKRPTSAPALPQTPATPRSSS